jgi:hypothetical protein
MRALGATIRFYWRWQIWAVFVGLAWALVGLLLGAASTRLWGYSPGEVREALAALALFALPPLLGLLLGGQSLGSGQGEQHLRFLASQGYSWGTLWLGALLAHLTLVAAATAVGIAPAAGQVAAQGVNLGLPLAATLAAWALGHLGALIFRQRSWLALVDLVALLLLLLAWRAYLALVPQLVRPGAAGLLLSLFFLAALMLLLMASFWVLRSSHLHLEKARRQVTWVLWPSLLLPALVGLGLLHSLAALAPKALYGVARAEGEATGRYWLISGNSYRSLEMPTFFLWDRQTGQRQRLPLGEAEAPYSGAVFVVAPEGPYAAFQVGTEDSRVTLLHMDTGQRKTLSLPPPHRPCALGPQGRLLALLQGEKPATSLPQKLLLVETETGKVTKQVSLGATSPACRAFASHLELLALRQTPAPSPSSEKSEELVFWRLDWISQELQEVFHLPVSPQLGRVWAESNGELLFLQLEREESPEKKKLWLVAQDGKLLWQQEAEDDVSASLTPLGILLVQPREQGSQLQLIPPAGDAVTASIPQLHLKRCWGQGAGDGSVHIECQSPAGPRLLRWRPGENSQIWAGPGDPSSWPRRPYYLSSLGLRIYGRWPTLEGQPLWNLDGRLGTLGPEGFRQVLP